MAFASLDDINIHLPDDKLEVDDAKYAPLQLDAERIIRGYLAGYVPPLTLSGWSSPDATPGLIRAVAGRLVAAFYYRQRYSEDSLDDPTFAQIKYEEAILWLTNIINGSMTLEDVDLTQQLGIGALDFYPNEAAFGPVFTMEMEL